MGNVVDLRKALSTDKLGTLGVRSPEQARRFIEKLRAEPTTLQYANVVQMSNESRVFNKLDITSRFIKPANEGIRLSDGDKVDPAHSTVTLTTYKYIGEMDITYETIEDNIARNQLIPQLRSLISRKVAEDISDYVMNGDTTSSDVELKRMNGFLKLATSNVYDLVNNPISLTHFDGALALFPLRYRTQLRNCKWILQPRTRDTYILGLTNVDTMLGDEARNTRLNPNPLGYPIQLDSIIDTYASGSNTDTRGLFTTPENMLIGIYRQFNIDLIDDRHREVFTLHVSGRVGCQYLEEEMVVKLNNIQIA
jgi:HK97 family phage major capsid protein